MPVNPPAPAPTAVNADKNAAVVKPAETPAQKKCC